MSRLPEALLGTAMGVLYAVLALGAVAGDVRVVVLAAIGLYVLDELVHRPVGRRLLTWLRSAGTGVSLRFLVRLLLYVVLVLRSPELSRRDQAVVVLAVVVHQAARLVFAGLQLFIARRRRQRAVTRGFEVPGQVLPPAPPPLVTRGGLRLLLHTDLLLTAGLAWAALTGSYRLVAPGAVATAVLALVLPLVLLAHAYRLLPHQPGPEQVHAVADVLREMAPEVVLYFSGSRNATYQVETWFDTMERLDRRVLVVLRERAVFESLRETTLPMVCLPGAVDLMNLALPTAHVALYVTNVGKNIHLLREPDLMSVFIGHGDSDKTASFNPYTKVYDEVWVAGEAGRDRYRKADVGVRDEQIVVVGRPQLDGVRRAGERAPGAPFTVLYAPTWEGWTEDPYHSSITTMGPEVVRTLLATPGVRVVFKPHPLTGTVDPQARRARAEVVGLLEAAGAPHAAVLGDTPTLYECFDEADALVSDISSVVSDFLASEKPYFVANGADLPEQEFRETYASAAAAHLIGPGAAGLADGLADVLGPDTMRERRRQVREYLLGSPDVPSLQRFQDAIDDLARRARRGHTHAEVPDTLDDGATGEEAGTVLAAG